MSFTMKPVTDTVHIYSPRHLGEGYQAEGRLEQMRQHNDSPLQNKQAHENKNPVVKKNSFFIPMNMSLYVPHV